MNRRSLLTAMAGGLAWSFLLPRRVLGAAPLVARTPEADLARRLVETLRRPASAAAVGRAYLAARPDEAAAPARLVEGICAAWRRDGGGPDPARAGRRALRRRLHAQLREDFAAGRTVDVAGWVLGETEARLFALAALAAGGTRAAAAPPRGRA